MRWNFREVKRRVRWPVSADARWNFPLGVVDKRWIFREAASMGIPQIAIRYAESEGHEVSVQAKALSFLMLSAPTLEFAPPQAILILRPK